MVRDCVHTGTGANRGLGNRIVSSVLDPEHNNFFSWSDSVSGFFDIIICTVRALLIFKFKSQLCNGTVEF